MKTLLKTGIFGLFFIFSLNLSAQNLSVAQKASVVKFTQLLKNQDWEGLSTATVYPLKRTYPIAPVSNATEFVQRHADLFDDSFRSMITNASVDSDWSVMGERGIMFKSGEIWLDTDGNLMSINHQTAAEKALNAKLIQADKDSLPVSLKEFEQPILQMKVGKFVLRIDQMKDESYRYAWWLEGALDEKHEPAEIIQNGILEFDGSGGNHSYTFESDFGKFVCSIIELGSSDSPPGELTIYRDGAVFRSFDAIWLKN